jgi:hypothetical protein
MADFVYMTTQEYPSIQLTWKNSNDQIIDFSSGYEWTVMLARGGEVALAKTTGVQGAGTAPNVTINWSEGELDVEEGTYDLIVIAVDGALKSRVFRPGKPPQVQIVPTPAPPA